MSPEGFSAIADVWVVPRPKDSKYYKKDWTKRLFSCIVRVDPHECDTTGDTSVLHVRLEDRKTHQLLATAPYDGQHGITSVNDSARHYVVTIQSRTLEAWLGIEFRNPADSIDFSLAIQSFMRRRMFADRQTWPTWSTRRTANLEQRRSPAPRSGASSSSESSGAELSSSESSGAASPASSVDNSGTSTPIGSPLPVAHTLTRSLRPTAGKPDNGPHRPVIPPTIAPPPASHIDHIHDDYSDVSTPSSTDSFSPAPSPTEMKSPTVTASPVDEDFGEFQTS